MSKPEILPLTLQSQLADSKLATKRFAAALSNGLGISTVADLLRHFPRRYEDRTQFHTIADLTPGGSATVSGEILRVQSVPTRNRMAITKVFISDRTAIAPLVFFNQWYLKKQFGAVIGSQIVAYGRAVTNTASRIIELHDVEWELIDPIDSKAGEPIGSGRIVPIYTLAEGIKQTRLRKLIWSALNAIAEELAERMPTTILRAEGLISFPKAIRQIHFPDSFELLEQARHRLVFDQFFIIQLQQAQRHHGLRFARGISFKNGSNAIEKLKSVLPFSLTNAQNRVIEEIRSDMGSPHPMNRLLQGDVGSGKTVVAMAALLIAVQNGYQAVIMAPTEILAEQHYSGIRQFKRLLDIPVALLTGSLSPNEKADLLQCIRDGVYPIVVGTHALIQESVDFKNIGLVIIDEQHRFGVMQRASLALKRRDGTVPDVLLMTATPIPRTLTLTLYGDLEVSIIDQLPPGRKPIKTHWKRSSDRESVYETLRQLLHEGRQAYIICALVEENEKLQSKAAVDLAEHLRTAIFPEFKIGLVHGQLKSAEKDTAMESFRLGETQILVATTVIEVGVDVTNASVIIIEDADRFGLAQLHQLRGRVGRGSTQSFCILIADPKNETAQARLSIMTATNDGFIIADEDLNLRGPGELFGTRQSGIDLPSFVDIKHDLAIFERARNLALEIISSDPELNKPGHGKLRALVESSPSIHSNDSPPN